jgi:hypothetical protein
MTDIEVTLCGPVITYTGESLGSLMDCYKPLTDRQAVASFLFSQ